MTRRAAVWLLLAALAVGCATGRAAPAGTLKIECNVPEATLRIDDVLLGRAADWAAPRTIPAGFHRLQIADAAHFTFSAEIRLREGEGAVVRAHLQQLLE